MPRCQQRWPVEVGGAQVGQVSSAIMSPDFGCGLAVAMMEREYWAPGTRVEVMAPDKPRIATVSALPFGPLTS